MEMAAATGNPRFLSLIVVADWRNDSLWRLHTIYLEGLNSISNTIRKSFLNSLKLRFENVSKPWGPWMSYRFCEWDGLLRQTSREELAI
jgi:hypothetical protein